MLHPEDGITVRLFHRTDDLIQATDVADGGEGIRKKIHQKNRIFWPKFLDLQI